MELVKLIGLTPQVIFHNFTMISFTISMLDISQVKLSQISQALQYLKLVLSMWLESQNLLIIHAIIHFNTFKFIQNLPPLSLVLLGFDLWSQCKIRFLLFAPVACYVLLLHLDCLHSCHCTHTIMQGLSKPTSLAFQSRACHGRARSSYHKFVRTLLLDLLLAMLPK